MKIFQFKIFSNSILFLLLSTPLIMYGQVTQIGQAFTGDQSHERLGRHVCINDNGNKIAFSFFPENSNLIKAYEYSLGTWSQIGSNIHTDGIIQDLSMNNDGDIIAISTSSNSSNHSDKVIIYKFNGIDWEQLGDIINSSIESPLNRFYSTISMDASGNTIVLSEFNLNDSTIGNIKAYKFIDNNWLQLGQVINIPQNVISFGRESKLSQDGLVIAVDALDILTIHKTIILYKLNNNTWQQIGERINSNDFFDGFGTSIDLNYDGSVIAIGAFSHDTPQVINSGMVRVYNLSNNEWLQMGEDLYGETSGDRFGQEVKLNSLGNVLAIGAPFDDGPNNPDTNHNSGQLKVYTFVNNSWNFSIKFNDETKANHQGKAISLNSEGTILAFSSRNNTHIEGNAYLEFNSGKVAVYDIRESLELIESGFDTDCVLLHPNPVKDKLIISNPNLARLYSLTIYNNMGQQIQTFDLNNVNSSKEIDVTNLASSSYFVNIHCEHGSTIKKMIKK